MLDYYETLGVAPEATEEEIRKGYRARANRWHPDKWCAEPEADRQAAALRFRQVREAYDHLIDPEKRRAYNRKHAAERSRRASVRRTGEDPSEVVSYAATVARELTQAIENAAEAQNDRRRAYWKIKQASWERTLDPIIAMLQQMHGPGQAENPAASMPRPALRRRRQRRLRRLIAAIVVFALMLVVVLLVAWASSV